tara:strand:+ start:210 stop:650 length:441 start_codon:yes stop_codon:yes gene_type:complete
MNENFVQGIVGGVLNRHKDKNLDENRIQTLMIEIAANIELVSKVKQKCVKEKEQKRNYDFIMNEMSEGEKEHLVAWRGHDGVEKMYEKEYLEHWKCELCGDHTHEVDYDYLGSGTNHLKCELEYQNEYNSYLDKGKQMELKFPKEK